MLKKAREARDTEAGSADAKDLSKSVLESSRQIWLAGLGAFSRAQAEGMKVFESLVRQGEAVETKTRQAATETASAARHAAQAKAKEVQQMAGGTWDKLEKVFEDRVARALTFLTNPAFVVQLVLSEAKIRYVLLLLLPLGFLPLLAKPGRVMRAYA